MRRLLLNTPYIVAVEYDDDDTRIEEVEILCITGKTFTQEIKTRPQIVSRILNDGLVIYTAYAVGAGSRKKLQHGAKVEPCWINEEWFLKTVANNDPRDNLGNLPSIYQ